MLRRIQYISVLLSVLLFAVFPDFGGKYGDALSLFLIVIIGIPHGAADHIIFSKIGKSFYGAKKFKSFIFVYLLLGLGFLLIWAFSPFKALILFILISIYHFGQEHFEFLDPNHWLTKLNISFWGLFVLLFPLIKNIETTCFYVGQMVGTNFSIPDTSFIIFTLAFLVIALIISNILLWKFRLIQFDILLSEMVQIMLLLLLYLTTPLLIGFAIYFVFWHSMNSMRDQFLFLSKKTREYSLKKYIIDILPFTFVAVTSVIVIGNYLINQTGQNIFTYLFILIALITLPHILLFDKLYSANNITTEASTVI
jgi:Brp/Blh family beta-carotene 15,15'-monooxygenase